MTAKLKLAICALALAIPQAAIAHGRQRPRHVLLISVDGLHASDLERWTATNPGSKLAWLHRRGTSYSNAHGSFPTDSFPGVLALTTGGRPKSTGVYYDNSYDRSLYPPTDTSCRGPAGTQVLFDESIDYDSAQLDGGAGAHGGQAIDPAKLPRAKSAQGCEPVYPSQFLRTNTIFGVAHDAGLRTAWSDKHPAYQLLNGTDPHAIDDLYTPEINSDAPGGGDYTSSESNVQTYDAGKVQAILNQIAGKPSTCATGAPCPDVGAPALFGMNFQAVSVAQKLPDPSAPLDPNGCGTGAACPSVGGYGADGSFNPNLASAMAFLDGSLGRIVAAMAHRRLLGSTQVIITAKHGQSPVDPAQLRRVSPDLLPALVTSTTGATFSDSGFNQQASVTQDDVALTWLSTPFQARAPALIAALRLPANRQALDAAHVIAGRRLQRLFGDPANDPRVPDVVVQPQQGGLYSFSKKKVAEHGGGAPDDRHIALLVVTPDRRGDRTVRRRVNSTQVAPSILQFLRLNPRALDAVREEHTPPLPPGGQSAR